ncbi:hypothetical protein RD110_14755 [Rhodoferax koreense]|uniref:DUF3304 domain-containing protein n=2 Tax=Rhodoferax koreensis TaxID=1842727 RepID=A0A1P8JX20_9BURK|nr:hypothetical protein RD110_14755 [Rhodoferax koreense]
MRKFRDLARRALLAVAAVVLATACSTGSEDLVPDKDKIGISISAVGHYGSMIGIPEFYLDGHWGGNAMGWGGGGGGMCCMLLPRKITKPVMVKVTWTTNRSNVGEARQHEETVPVNFAVPPGDSAGLFVHFLPGHHVELWVTPGYPEGSKYPGPKFPRRPAPAYSPLPDEKPQPAITGKQPGGATP